MKVNPLESVRTIFKFSPICAFPWPPCMKVFPQKKTNIAPQELGQNCSLLASCIWLTGYWYESGYIIHVKQTLAVTNCFTRNKIVYLLQNREQKELEILIWMEDNRSIGNVINTTEIIPMNLKFKCQTVASFFCVTTINLSEYIELVEKG